MFLKLNFDTNGTPYKMPHSGDVISHKADAVTKIDCNVM